MNADFSYGRAPLLFAGLIATALAGGCAASADKPIDTKELRTESKPGLAAYLAATVPGAKLTAAEPFGEGHMHETWKLTADVGGKQQIYALKLFRDDKQAKADAANYQAARDLGWPLPADVSRGSAKPYKDLPAYLSEFVPGRSLAKSVTHSWNMGKNRAAEIAKFYAEIGTKLGALHKASMRARKPGDISGAALMLDLAELCLPLMWCGPHTHQTLKDVAKNIDGTEVAFIHGDLYETQMILDDSGSLATFLDLDEAGYGDPAMDVGYLLAHILLVNPIARQAIWGIPNPGVDEQKATAEAFLGSYKAAAGLEGPDWATFIDRTKAYMRLRVGRLMIKYNDNVHARELLNLVDKKKVTLFVVDPLVDLGVNA
jgi:aminoglycoside phosphotransferase (APT) family kinase protein